jgi:hypothetical protein
VALLRRAPWGFGQIAIIARPVLEFTVGYSQRLGMLGESAIMIDLDKVHRLRDLRARLPRQCDQDHEQAALFTDVAAGILAGS